MASQESSTPPPQQDGGVLSTILVGAAILGFAAWFLFFRGGDEPTSKTAESASRAGSSSMAQPGGLGERKSDPVRAVDRDGPEAAAVRTLVPPEPEPEPRTREEKIARAERDLRRARDRLTRIEKGMERFDEAKARAIENAKNPEYKAREWDRKAENMAKNLEITKLRIEELEDTLASLQQGDAPSAPSATGAAEPSEEAAEPEAAEPEAAEPEEN